MCIRDRHITICAKYCGAVLTMVSIKIVSQLQKMLFLKFQMILIYTWLSTRLYINCFKRLCNTVYVLLMQILNPYYQQSKENQIDM